MHPVTGHPVTMQERAQREIDRDRLFPPRSKCMSARATPRTCRMRSSSKNCARLQKPLLKVRRRGLRRSAFHVRRNPSKQKKEGERTQEEEKKLREQAQGSTFELLEAAFPRQLPELNDWLAERFGRCPNPRAEHSRPDHRAQPLRRGARTLCLHDQ